MESNRKLWNQQQKILRNVLEGKSDQDQAIELFLKQHAMLHAAEVSGMKQHSFVDEVWQDMTEEVFRRIPNNEHHSIAWILWHMARVEDVTMNMLVADTSQLLDQDNWETRLKVPFRHTGNGMPPEEIATLSTVMHMEALWAYRMAVGRRTRDIVSPLQPQDFTQKIDPVRIQNIWEQQSMRENAQGIVTYWSRRTVAGLLLMPPTRHNFVHLNEARRVKQRKR